MARYFAAPGRVVLLPLALPCRNGMHLGGGGHTLSLCHIDFGECAAQCESPHSQRCVGMKRSGCRGGYGQESTCRESIDSAGSIQMRINTMQIGHAVAGMGLLVCCMGQDPEMYGSRPTAASSVFFEEEQLADAESGSAAGARSGSHANLAQAGAGVGLGSNGSARACGGLACANVSGGTPDAQRMHRNPDGIGLAGSMAAASLGGANQDSTTSQGSRGSAALSSLGREGLPSGGPSFGNPSFSAPPAGRDEPASTPTMIALNEPDAVRDTALPAAVPGSVVPPGLVVPGSVTPGSVLPATDPLSPTALQPDLPVSTPDGNAPSPAFSTPGFADRSGAPLSRGSDVFKKPSGPASPAISSSALPTSEPGAMTAVPGRGRVPAGNDGSHTVPGSPPVGNDILDFADPLKADPPGLVDRVAAAIHDPEIAGIDPRQDSAASPLLGNAPVELLFNAPEQAIERVADATTPWVGQPGSPFIPSGLDVDTIPLTTLAALDVPEPSTLALFALAMLGLGTTRGPRRQPRRGLSA
ncbi:PEP-CTERM sorting domain-containing protein [Aquabacterium sp.]|uniref:PEP-CTERM sorting domain-containing protein n=1 Tax=Aquabacterium sp. TaxID=1872578 RepID=UPI002D802A74|nr:PEP-CTERM sorting domain-containing protein [Aquabacterium sp.]